MTGNEDKKPSDGNSALPVMFLLKPSGLNEQDSASVKCSKCDAVTMHRVFKVQPEPTDPNIDPLEILKLAKRLSMCTHCGNLRLTN